MKTIIALFTIITLAGCASDKDCQTYIAAQLAPTVVTQPPVTVVCNPGPC